MKKFPKILLGVIIICLLFIGFLYVNNDIGVKASNLETDIRKSQKIPKDWSIDGSISDTMAAFISYPRLHCKIHSRKFRRMCIHFYE